MTLQSLIKILKGHLNFFRIHVLFLLAESHFTRFLSLAAERPFHNFTEPLHLSFFQGYSMQQTGRPMSRILMRYTVVTQPYLAVDSRLWT